MSTLKANMLRGFKVARKKFYVKYMLSLQCKKIAKRELNKLGLIHTISNGTIELNDNITQVQLEALKQKLKNSGMVLLDGTDSLLVDRIITSIKEAIHHSDHLPKITYDEIINKKIVLESKHILKIFSEIKGVSLLHYIIIQKIEKVKELLLYSDYSLPEISDRLNYKNETLLTAQLKKYTGLSPDYFREIKQKRESRIRNQKCLH